MRVSLRRAVPSVAAVWLLLAGSAAAGVRIETEQREPGSNVALGRTVYYLDACRLRLEAQSEEGEDIVIIFRADRSLSWLIDQRDGTYVELTSEKIAKLREQLEAQRQQREKDLAKLPPEQRVVKAERRTFEPGLFDLPRGLRKTEVNPGP